MKAFLYAAGIGRRLEEHFGKRPKVLLEFGGRTLLDWHLQRLAQAGVKELVVVTGYCRDMLEAAIARLGEDSPVRITTRHNPDYTEGSVLSVAASLPDLEGVKEPVLVMDADVLYPSVFLGRLIHSQHASALLVDRDFSTADDDPVLVPVREGRPFDFVKQWRGRCDWMGESVGFFKLSPEHVTRFVAETRKRLTGAGRRESLDDVLRLLVQDGCFGLEDITGLPWTEIDFPGDVDRAEREVLPAIMGLGPGQRGA